MAVMDLIEPSTSPWSAPAIMVPKKNGKLRLCVDYRRLNKKTIPDSQPLPHIGDSLDALGGAKWFSTLDLKMGLYQVSVAEHDRPKLLLVYQAVAYGNLKLCLSVPLAVLQFSRGLWKGYLQA